MEHFPLSQDRCCQCWLTAVVQDLILQVREGIATGGGWGGTRGHKGGGAWGAAPWGAPGGLGGAVSFWTSWVARTWGCLKGQLHFGLERGEGCRVPHAVSLRGMRSLSKRRARFEPGNLDWWLKDLNPLSCGWGPPPYLQKQSKLAIEGSWVAVQMFCRACRTGVKQAEVR